MGLLWIFYEESYQQFVFKDDAQGSISIGSTGKSSICIQSLSSGGGPIELKPEMEEGVFTLFCKDEQLGTIKPHTPITIFIEGLAVSFYSELKPINEVMYYMGDRQQVVFSTDGAADIHKEGVWPFQKGDGKPALVKRRGNWHVIPAGDDDIYLNGIKITEAAELKLGDLLFWPFMTVSMLEQDLLAIKTAEPFKASLPRMQRPTSEMQKNYPGYRRTPRMVYELPDDKVTISFPSQEGEDNQRGLWIIILPPLLMLMIMGIIALIQPRGLFILISIVMFGTTMVTSTVQYFKDKKNRKQRKKKRKEVYTKYLEQKREELQILKEEQAKVLNYHFPDFERMKYLTENISDRIWERSFESSDFLHVRAGRADVPSSYQVSASSSDVANREIDDLLEQSQEMVNVYKKVEGVPLPIDLSSGAVGFVGKDSIVKKELQQIIGQLAFLHSYHDIRFVAVFKEEEYQDWEWMKWLPHFQMPHSYAKGLVYDEQTRDQLLSSLYQILRSRDLEEDKEKVRHVPHFIFIVTNPSLIAEHVILEYLEGSIGHIGLTSLFAADSKESLTEGIHTVIKYINEREGEILIQHNKADHTLFELDAHSMVGNERFSRRLRSLDHQKGMNNSIPDMVSYLQLLGVKEAEELPIETNWNKNQSSQSLAVPIGLKGKKDIVELNLHEKAHGPHGLIAGTTGSGKSELLQTYILSLAAHFHPHEVGFLLIDYKGGGMAQPFKNMPHLLGTITNIQGSRNFSTRALASIKSELKKRQRLFDAYEVNHINDYTDLYKEGKAKEPLPHLFLISDEFAELKSEEPEFIRELVSAARIGRSLGVHLILATQKPGGIIDNQIWSNARFKIALKVQDEGDSKEIIKNGDAANITLTGRGYLQVGNNEVYDLFQSAWSGAPYMEDTYGAEDEVAFVTDLGLIQISNIAAQSNQGRKQKQTEIEAVVKEIIKVQKKLGIQKLASPWLPPLEDRLALSYKESDRYRFKIGLKDEPEKQSQSPCEFHLVEDGNIGIFGSSGFGKSTTILTLLMNFASQYSPEELIYYVFDFGNSALLPLRQLSHTADYFRFDEQRKIDKFLHIIKAEIEHRKQLFLEAEVSNLKMYNSKAENPLPTQFIAVDNFDLVKEEMQDIENQFTQIARDGQSLGIFMIISATRINAIRQPLMNNLKTKIIHYLMDSSEKYSLLGRTTYEIEAVPGRALVKEEQTYLTQIYMPASGKDDFQVLENLRQQIAKLNTKYKESRKPNSVPMLPTHLNLKTLYGEYPVQTQDGLIPIGLDEERVQPVYLNLKVNRHYLVVGQSRKGKTNSLRVMLDALLVQNVEEIGLFDAIDRGLSSYASQKKVRYLDSRDDITDFLLAMDELFEVRSREYLDSLQANRVQELVFKPVIMMIDSISRFQQTVDAKIQDKITGYIKHYSHLGFSLIAAGNANEFTKGFDSLTSELKQIRHAILLMKKSDQSLFTLPFSRKEEEIQPGFGYYVENSREYKIQIPNVIEEQIPRVKEESR
ncbi:type VII secretion protein EssC [Peribacillus deserti]|uniref:Type VII secretion protein EssC n=1 Tax=Peribacillus deserti TaxID=673318 RepID=A0A2N5MAT7_9BACI|nr:type VII secretion protein EssC [Peribacillus deserti]PLT31471.1 type VII secretion protein EssC [Peribacillus deserti]